MFVLADVYTVTLIIVGILITVPALLIALNLLLPRFTERIQQRAQANPVMGLVLGGIVGLAAVLLVAILAQAPGPLRTLAWVAGLVLAAVGALGAAGISRLLGLRLGQWSAPTSRLNNLVRGAVIYELAALVPLLGWFVFLPLMALIGLGTAVLALFPTRTAPISQSPNLPTP